MERVAVIVEVLTTLVGCAVSHRLLCRCAYKYCVSDPLIALTPLLRFCSYFYLKSVKEGFTFLSECLISFSQRCFELFLKGFGCL